MTKEQVINGCLEVIKRIAKEKGNLTVIDKGTGHAFDGSFWDNIFTDKSNIPHVDASGDGFSIELRPFWTSPELDIRRENNGLTELIIITFSDFERSNDKGYHHTGDFEVSQVRVDGLRGNYMEAISYAYSIINEIRKAAGYDVTKN